MEWVLVGACIVGLMVGVGYACYRYGLWKGQVLMAEIAADDMGEEMARLYDVAPEFAKEGIVWMLTNIASEEEPDESE